MNTKVIGLSIAAVLISFIGGFLIANALNKKEIESLKAENNRYKTSQTNPGESGAEASLSDDEIRQRIQEADQNPDNIQFQKNLGMALYRYASMKQDAKLLGEVARILNRAYEKNPADRDVAVTLGNLYFDIGYFDKNNDGFKKARDFYGKILDQTPNDVEVRTDNGLTYFLENPPDLERAATEFQKSYKINPKHEKTLQFLVQTYVKQGKNAEAENYLAQLREIDPKAPSLAEIQKQIAQ